MRTTTLRLSGVLSRFELETLDSSNEQIQNALMNYETAVQGPLSFLQEDIERLERRFIELTMTNNAVEMSKLLMPTFTCVNHYGALVDREEFLNQFKTGSTQVATAEQHSFDVEFLSGEIALVRGLINVNMKYPSWTFKGLTIYSRLWQKRDGVFKAVFLHVSDAQMVSDWNKLLKK